MAKKNDILGGLFSLAKNVGMTTHAIGIKGFLANLSAVEPAVDAVAKALRKAARTDDMPWKSLTDGEREKARYVARVALNALAEWYEAEVDGRLRGAVLGGKR